MLMLSVACHCKTTPSVVPTPPETIHLMEHLSMGPVSAAQIWQPTDHHLLLAKVKRFVQHGWLDHMVQELKELALIGEGEMN